MNKLLDDFVYQIISERAMSSVDADNEHLAILIKHQYGQKTITLYDSYELVHCIASRIREKMKKWKLSVNNIRYNHEHVKDLRLSAQSNVDKWMRGHITISESNYPSNGAYEVHGPAAVAKYGPLMYDVAMSLNPAGIVPDRKNVSDEARQIWKYYKEKRQDVQSHKLDDINYPKTDSEFDDSPLYHRASEDFLNYSYTSSKKIDTLKMESNHQKTMTQLAKMGFADADIENLFRNSAEKFFWSLYKG